MWGAWSPVLEHHTVKFNSDYTRIYGIDPLIVGRPDTIGTKCRAPYSLDSDDKFKHLILCSTHTGLESCNIADSIVGHM